MIEYVLIDQIQEAFDQFNRVCLFIRKFLIYMFSTGAKVLIQYVNYNNQRQSNECNEYIRKIDVF